MLFSIFVVALMMYPTVIIAVNASFVSSENTDCPVYGPHEDPSLPFHFCAVCPVSSPGYRTPIIQKGVLSDGITVVDYCQFVHLNMDQLIDYICSYQFSATQEMVNCAYLNTGKGWQLDTSCDLGTPCC